VSGSLRYDGSVPVTEKTRQEDQKLREQLKHVDPAKLRKVIKVLVEQPAKSKTIKPSIAPSANPRNK
jgi:hypothetical protein